jgi:hypothetical protein
VYLPKVDVKGDAIQSRQHDQHRRDKGAEYITLSQLRCTLFVVTNLWRDLHPQDAPMLGAQETKSRDILCFRGFAK